MQLGILMNRRARLLITMLVLLLLDNKSYSRQSTNNFHKYKNKNAKELLIKGEVCCHNGKWEEGRKILRYIEEYLPSSPELPTAKLALADSFFFCPNHSYSEAIVEYKNYLKIFPNSQKRDYVLYRISLCEYAAIGKLERDQTKTQEAIAAFQELLKEAPNSIYTEDAINKISICRHRLAETELRIGIYYVKIFKYQNAEKRLKGLLDAYQDCCDYKRTYFFLAEALYQNGIATNKNNINLVEQHNHKSREEYLVEAKFYYKKVIEMYPKSHLALKATKRLISIG
jgi:outer membrane protein assembly factor BamD